MKRVYQWIKRVFSWIAKRLQIFATVVAIATSIIGLILTKQTLELGIQSQEATRQSNLVSRLPAITTGWEDSETGMALVFTNVGPGPADIYQVELAYKGHHVTLRREGDNSIETLQKLSAAIETDIGYQDAQDVRRNLRTPGTVFPSGYEVRVLSYIAAPGELKNTGQISGLLEIRICYQDVAGEIKLETVLNEGAGIEAFQCDPNPRPFVTIGE